MLWYICRRLFEPFVFYPTHAGGRRRRTLQIDEPYKERLPGITRARDFLIPFLTPELAGIITTNYDLLVEYALGSQNFHYGIPGELLTGPGAHPMRPGPVPLRGEFPYAKLHGSVSWDARARYTDGRRGISGEALIVAPVPEKVAPQALQSVWECTQSILAEAERLVVFGFAFNPYDEAVLDLLRSGGRRLRSVELIDISPPVARARELWPQAQIHATHPPQDLTVSAGAYHGSHS